MLRSPTGVSSKLLPQPGTQELPGPPGCCSGAFLNCFFQPRRGLSLGHLTLRTLGHLVKWGLSILGVNRRFQVGLCRERQVRGVGGEDIGTLLEQGDGRRD